MNHSLDNVALAFKAHHSVAIGFGGYGGLDHLCPRTELGAA